MSSAAGELSELLGAYPRGDGWSAAYRLHAWLGRRLPWLAALIHGYLRPRRWELWGRSRVYRLLGVGVFGGLIPTGGVVVRRLTGSRMRPYTLAGHSLDAARRFYYRACLFELCHLPFVLALAALSLWRLQQGRPDLALENTLINLAVNLYPMLHHRHTRARIYRLLRRAAGRPAPTG